MATPTSVIKVYSTPFCGDCRRAKRWLKDNNVPFEDINIEDDADAIAYVMQVNNGNQSVPTIIFPDGSILVEQSNTVLAAQVKQVLGTTSKDAS